MLASFALRAGKEIADANSSKEKVKTFMGESSKVHKWLWCSLTPELTGAGGPIGPQGTNIGHEDGEAMANVGVRVERIVRHSASAINANILVIRFRRF